MNNKLSKADESELPKFKDHLEAIKYFNEKYGDDFVFSNNFIFEGNNIHVYLLVLNRKKFYEMQKYIIDRGGVPLIPVSDPTTKGYTDSYQSIHIHENGKVSVII